jgi:L-gulonate 5-dehydrogenase
MKAAIAYAPRDIRLTHTPDPEPGPDDVLLDVRTVGICGSDIHLFRGDHPYKVFPLIYGHEFDATVAALGERAGGSGLVVGDHVVVEPLLACGECYPCRIGRPNCCTRLKVIGVHTNGGFAERVVVPARCVHALPQELPSDIASLCEPFSIGMQAAGRAAISDADRVVVLGAGPIGQTVLAIAASLGAPVAVVDMIDSRLELARAMGAELTINAATSDVQQAVLDFTDGEGASVVVEATGNTRAMESTVGLVAAAGRIVMLGVPDKPVTLPGLEFTRKELTILGSRNNAGRFPDAVRFVLDHRAQVAQLISRSFAFDEVVAAFEMADTQPDKVCKVVVNVR